MGAVATAGLLPATQLMAQSSVALLSTAANDFIKNKWKKTPSLKGQFAFRFFGLDIYQAQLWVDGAINANLYEEGQLALQLVYARNLNGNEIAKRSLQEIKNQVKVSPEQEKMWLEQMVKIFPDVKNGDNLTGVYGPSQKAVFFFNQKYLGELSDVELSKRFFGIWLSPQTSEPKMRLHLLGLN
jgi:hypothetical protein